MSDVNTLIKLDMTLGECPRWNATEQAWYWVDILGKHFYRFDTTSQALKKRKFEFSPGCFTFTNRNHILLTASDGVYWLDNFNAPARKLANPERQRPNNRFNDGVTTPDGDFIAGTIGDGSAAVGTSYQMRLRDKTLRNKSLQTDWKIINGQAFSPDGCWYYVTDTPSQKIMRRSYDKETQTFGAVELFYQCEADEYPDGAAIDQDGNYWVAMYGSSKVSVISAAGEKIKDIALPVSQPTMVAFGGKDLNQLIITSAKQNLSEDELAEQPLAGSVLLLDVDCKGFVPTPMSE